MKIYLKELINKFNDDLCKKEDFNRICRIPEFKSKLEDAQLSAIVTCNNLLEDLEDLEDLDDSFLEPFADCVTGKAFHAWMDIVSDNFCMDMDDDAHEAKCVEGMEQEHCKAIMALRDDCTSNKSNVWEDVLVKAMTSSSV